MTLFQSLLFLALFVPVLAIVCVAVVEARREPSRDRPMMLDGIYGSGDGGGGGCGDGS